MYRTSYLLMCLFALLVALPVMGQPVASEAPPDPLRVELDSPRATMFTFLRAMGEIQQGREVERAWEVVGQTLELPVDANGQVGVEATAEALLEVLDKLGTVDELSLPDAADVRQDGLGRYVYFPGHEDQQWVWEELKAFGRWPLPEGRIVLAAAGAEEAGASAEPGAWRFTLGTTATIGQLAESLAPLPPRHIAGASEEKVFLTVLGPTFDQTPWWGWLSLLAAIFAGLVIGKLTATALRSVSGRLTRRGWAARGMAFEDAASPASLALLTLGLAIGLHAFIHLDEQLTAFVNSIITFLYLIALGWFLYNLVDVVEVGLSRFTSRTSTQLDDMILPLIRKSLRIFILVVFSLVVAQNVFGLNITGWLAGLGIAGLAVSLAAQDSVKNLFGSLTVFFDQPFAVGEFIDYGGTTGTVEEIGFRSTRIRTVTGHLVTVPNMKWIDSQVENISVRPSIRRVMDIRLPYDTPVHKVDEAVRIVGEVLADPQVVEEGRFDLDASPPRVYLDELRDDSLNIKAFYWYQLAGDPGRGYYSWLEHCDRVNRELVRRFADADLQFALPTRTLHLADDPARPLAVTVKGGDTVNGG